MHSISVLATHEIYHRLNPVSYCRMWQYDMNYKWQSEVKIIKYNKTYKSLQLTEYKRKPTGQIWEGRELEEEFQNQKERNCRINDVYIIEINTLEKDLELLMHTH